MNSLLSSTRHSVRMLQHRVMGSLYSSTLTSGEQPKIVIIGAGASGIAAASKLFENGFENVTILEAEDRIGGRVYSTWFGEHPAVYYVTSKRGHDLERNVLDDSWVDIGGQWVHGQKNNIVYELASPLGLLEVPPVNTSLVFNIYNSQGSTIPASRSKKLMGLYYDVVERVDDSLNNETKGSSGELYARMLDIEFAKDPTISEAEAKGLLKFFESLSVVADGSDNWWETSARGYLEYRGCPGSSVINWKDRSYGTILDILMKRYPNPDEELPVLSNTLLNSEVSKIDYNSTEGKAVVRTNNGERYIADHVITTASLGVLKEQCESLFTPRLPESKVKTIQGLGFGTVVKIFLSFEEPWWPENTSNFGFIWHDEERQEYEHDPDKKWLVDLTVFSPVQHRPRLLCGWICGVNARHMETLPEDQVLNQTFALLEKFLGNSFNLTRPTGMIRSQWYSNKHFRGSYSFRSLETEKADVWADGLAAPLLVNEKPIVMFAGEATHSHHYGTVHGAIDSGYREANRIIDLYKRKPE